MCSISAQAQLVDSFATAAADPVPPYALLQYSTLTGSGNTITVNWLPVVTASGTTYKDITLQFEVDASGNLTIASGYPQIVPSPTPLISGFTAGKYVGPSTIFNGQMAIVVSGPGIAPGGATEWSLASASGAYASTYPSSATWYVGSIATSPIAARLNKAGITSTAWYYGVSGSQAYNWYNNSLLGFSQIGKTLTIVDFTDGAGDHNQPVAQVTYTLSQ